MFSQFWTHMMLIGRHLRAAGVRCAELRSHMKAAEKARALHRFRSDPAVGAPQHGPRRWAACSFIDLPLKLAECQWRLREEATKVTADDDISLPLLQRCPSGAMADGR